MIVYFKTHFFSFRLDSFDLNFECQRPFNHISRSHCSVDTLLSQSISKIVLCNTLNFLLNNRFSYMLLLCVPLVENANIDNVNLSKYSCVVVLIFGFIFFSFCYYEQGRDSYWDKLVSLHLDHLNAHVSHTIYIYYLSLACVSNV